MPLPLPLLPQDSSVGPSFLIQLSMAAIALIVATVPRDDWKERSNDSKANAASTSKETAGGGRAGDTVPLRYNPAELAVYFSRRPVAVVQRNAVVAKHFCAFVGSIMLDAKTGNWEKAMPGRAKWLRLIAEELGPTYVKVCTKPVTWRRFQKPCL